MLLSDWQNSPGSSSQSFDLSTETVWVKTVSMWLTVFLYVWTLLAPLVCPDRFQD
jgi:hypothetical protein